MPHLVLYSYWRSSSSYRVRIALALKGLEYEYVAVNLLADEHSGEAHRARTPTGFVPCLAVDGANYFESVAIVELLDELFPSPALYPRDPHGRARVRALVEIANSGIQPLHNRSTLQLLSPEPARQIEWVQRVLPRGLASLEAALAANEREGMRGPFAYGDGPSAADAFLVPAVYAARRFHVDIAPYARVARAHAAASELEAVQRAAPERQPDAVKK
jgi:maleylpyruvate isomerase